MYVCSMYVPTLICMYVCLYVSMYVYMYVPKYLEKYTTYPIQTNTGVIRKSRIGVSLDMFI